MSKATSQDLDSGSTAHPSSRMFRILALSCSCVALVLIFLTLFDWDIPLTRFVRSLNDVQLDHLANPWLARLSDVGDRLGKGESLIILSLVILGVGYGLKHSVWKEAGWKSLIAHGLAAVSSNLLKHAIGRPRPKFMHAGTLELSPSAGSGWDSFPSGHATASCAVAMVLAIRFPKAKWVILTIALAIAASRIVRGAHYLTDVTGGALLGCLLGRIAASPLREWRASLASAVRILMPVVAGLFIALWTLLQLPQDTGLFHMLVVGGWLLTLGGLAGHVLWTIRASLLPSAVTGPLALETIGLGLAMATGSLLLTTVALLVCAAHWLDRHADNSKVMPMPDVLNRSTAIREGFFAGAVLLGLVGSYSLRGIVPMP
jgi:undecaprenyl-diphosphatase